MSWSIPSMFGIFKFFICSSISFRLFSSISLSLFKSFVFRLSLSTVILVSSSFWESIFSFWLFVNSGSINCSCDSFVDPSKPCSSVEGSTFSWVSKFSSWLFVNSGSTNCSCVSFVDPFKPCSTVKVQLFLVVLNFLLDCLLIQVLLIVLVSHLLDYSNLILR